MEMVRAVFTYCFKATALLEYCNCQIPNQKTHTQTHTHISVTRKQLYNRTLFTKCIPHQKLSVPSVLSAPSTPIITSLLHLHIHSVTLQQHYKCTMVESGKGRWQNLISHSLKRTERKSLNTEITAQVEYLRRMFDWLPFGKLTLAFCRSRKVVALPFSFFLFELEFLQWKKKQGFLHLQNTCCIYCCWC